MEKETIQNCLEEVKKTNLEFFEKELKNILLSHFMKMKECFKKIIDKNEWGSQHGKLRHLLNLEEKVDYEIKNPTTIDTMNFLKLCNFIDIEVAKLLE